MTIEVTPTEYAFIQAMRELNVFKIKNGTLSVDFDRKGAIGSIKVLQHYRIGLDK